MPVFDKCSYQSFSEVNQVPRCINANSYFQFSTDVFKFIVVIKYLKYSVIMSLKSEFSSETLYRKIFLFLTVFSSARDARGMCHLDVISTIVLSVLPVFLSQLSVSLAFSSVLLAFSPRANTPDFKSELNLVDNLNCSAKLVACIPAPWLTPDINSRFNFCSFNNCKAAFTLENCPVNTTPVSPLALAL